jgi:competence ComEA-like helix-hairpin-helix protein
MFLAAAFYYFAVSAGASSLPPGNGKAIVQRTCKGCHALKVVTAKRASRQQWSVLVNQMVSRGADLEDEEIEVVIDYLAKNFPRGKPPSEPAPSACRKPCINVNKASAAQLAAALDLPPKESAAIVAYRRQNGAFKDWHDLIKVPGVEAEKIESKKQQLAF